MRFEGELHGGYAQISCVKECTNVDGGMLEQEGKSRVWQPWTCTDRSYLM
jgi:hypothetical protein